jgi:hypothetical protein
MQEEIWIAGLKDLVFSGTVSLSEKLSRTYRFFVNNKNCGLWARIYLCRRTDGEHESWISQIAAFSSYYHMIVYCLSKKF